MVICRSGPSGANVTKSGCEENSSGSSARLSDVHLSRSARISLRRAALTGGNCIFTCALPASATVTTSTTASVGAPQVVQCVNSIFATGTVSGNKLVGYLGGNASFPFDSGVSLSYNATTGVLTALVGAPVPFALTDAATISLPLASSGIGAYSVTIAGNRTLGVPTGGVAGQTYQLFVTQDGTGSRTLTKATGMKAAGGSFSLTATAGATDIVQMFYDGSTYWAEVFAKAYA